MGQFNQPEPLFIIVINSPKAKIRTIKAVLLSIRSRKFPRVPKSAADQGTTLTFLHEGLNQSFECYTVCESGWDYFLVSLQAYLETGKGTPFLKAALIEDQKEFYPSPIQVSTLNLAENIQS